MFDGLFQPMHLLIVLAIALIIFGPKKLPELGAGLGKGIREFKKAMQDAAKDIRVDPETKEIASPATLERNKEDAAGEKATAKKEITV